MKVRVNVAKDSSVSQLQRSAVGAVTTKRVYQGLTGHVSVPAPPPDFKRTSDSSPGPLHVSVCAPVKSAEAPGRSFSFVAAPTLPTEARQLNAPTRHPSASFSMSQSAILSVELGGATSSSGFGYEAPKHHPARLQSTEKPEAARVIPGSRPIVRTKHHSAAVDLEAGFVTPPVPAPAQWYPSSPARSTNRSYRHSRVERSATTMASSPSLLAPPSDTMRVVSPNLNGPIVASSQRLRYPARQPTQAKLILPKQAQEIRRERRSSGALAEQVQAMELSPRMESAPLRAAPVCVRPASSIARQGLMEATSHVSTTSRVPRTPSCAYRVVGYPAPNDDVKDGRYPSSPSVARVFRQISRARSRESSTSSRPTLPPDGPGSARLHGETDPELSTAGVITKTGQLRYAPEVSLRSTADRENERSWQLDHSSSNTIQTGDGIGFSLRKDTSPAERSALSRTSIPAPDVATTTGCLDDGYAKIPLMAHASMKSSTMPSPGCISRPALSPQSLNRGGLVQPKADIVSIVLRP